LRMDPSRVRPFLGQFAETHLRDALRCCLLADGRLKGGSGGKPEMLLDRLVLELCDRPAEEAPRPSQTSGGAMSRTRPVSNVRTISGKPPKSSRAG
jgi:hypothetical protein